MNKQLLLSVELIDTSHAINSVLNLGESVPFQRRIVTIKLTEEQMKAIEPRNVNPHGSASFETIGAHWLYESEDS